MQEYRFNQNDRRLQLQELVATLDDLIPLVAQYPELRHQQHLYENGKAQALQLLQREFSQQEVLALGKSIPDLFYRYREWEPPMEQRPDGSWQEPQWFAELEPRLQKVLSAADKLRSLGYY